MPAETPYTPQLGPARPSALPQASPADFGAGVGAGIAQLGGVLHDSEVKAYHIQRQLETNAQRADFAKKFAQARTDLDVATDEARKTPGADAEAFMKAAAERYDSVTKDLTSGINDDAARGEADGQIAIYRAGYVAGEHQYATVTIAKSTATNFQTATDVVANRIQFGSNDGAYPLEKLQREQEIDALDVAEPVKVGLRRDMDEKYGTAQLRRMMRKNPADMIASVDRGDWNAVIPNDELNRLRNEAEADIHVKESQARAAASQAVTVEKDQLAASGTVLDGGAGSYGDRVALSQRYSSLGDQSKAAEWAGKAEAFKAAAGSASWTLPQLDRRIVELQGKQNTGGLTGPEGFELKGLVDRRSATASNLNQDGGALVQLSVATGKPIAPLIPGDQQSMRGRSAAAIAAANRYGRPQVEPLLQSEMAGLKDLMANGTGGKQEVLSVLAGFGDPRAIVGAAQQLSGGQDGAFVMAARVMGYPAGQQIARDILAGQDAMKTRGAKWKEQKAQTDFAAWYGTALRDAGTDYRRNVFEGAKALYAARRGDSPYDAGYFADAVESVMGRSKSGATVRGGVAHVGGLSAPGGWVVIAPPTMAPDEMMRRFARGATYDYAKASGGTAPVWADGHPFKRSDLNAMVPRLLANGRYGFVNPRTGGLIHDNRGQEYSVDIDLLPGLVRRGK